MADKLDRPKNYTEQEVLNRVFDRNTDRLKMSIPTGAEGQWLTDLFGQPEIRCGNEGWGQWENKALQAKYKDSYDTNRQFRYGNWAVHLNGGPQASGESYASVSVPITEMKVKDVAKIEYTWYNHVTGTAHIGYIGPNLVWSAYDPNDHSKRVDFNTYAVDNGGVNPTAGWHEYLLTKTDATERVYWYGNNTGSHDTAPAEGADGYWSQYITDVGFQNWVIYRVQIMAGFWSGTRSTGDHWIGGLKINGIPVKWEPSEIEKIAIARRDAEMFGKPTLVACNNGRVNWERGSTSPLDQKSATGWLARLYGGVQTGDDWARVNIPVNEMRVPDFKTALWTYWMTAAQTMGVGMVIWVHDPFNPDYRCEITQLANVSGLEKAAGWDKHILIPTTDQFFYYGEEPASVSNLTEGTQYGWDDFVADELFNTWTIYRITFEYGWEASGTFDSVYVADIQLNGVTIPLGSVNGNHKKNILTTKTVIGGGCTAGDIISENASTGTDWDFDFGGTGYITKAVAVLAAANKDERLRLWLFSAPPTSEVDDNAVSTAPLAADVPYLVGYIDFPAMSSQPATAFSVAVASPSTVGNLPLAFDSPILYGILIGLDGITLTNVLLSIHLFADMEDN